MELWSLGIGPVDYTSMQNAYPLIVIAPNNRYLVKPGSYSHPIYGSSTLQLQLVLLLKASSQKNIMAHNRPEALLAQLLECPKEKAVSYRLGEVDQARTISRLLMGRLLG